MLKTRTPERPPRAPWPIPPARSHAPDDLETVKACINATCETAPDTRYRIQPKDFQRIWRDWVGERRRTLWDANQPRVNATPYGEPRRAMLWELYEQDERLGRRETYSHIWLRRQLRLLGYGETRPNGAVWITGLREKRSIPLPEPAHSGETWDELERQLVGTPDLGNAVR